MDIRSFNHKLNKISALTVTGQDDMSLSQLERDLILSYIRDLYEIALDSSQATSKLSVPKIEAVKVAPIEQTVAVQAPVKIVEEVPVPVVAEPITPTVEMSLPKVDVPEIAKPIEQIPSQEIFQSVSTPKVSSLISPEVMAELFAEEKISDLSDKLALSPVKDLTKSMGINERIFTQQELFGNNQQQFNDTLQRLNNCQNFEEAKQYLIENVITTYGWTNENRLKKASTFVKLVKRKFS